MARRAEAEDPFLGPALFLVAPRPAEGRVKAVLPERLLEPFGLPQIGVERAVIERVDPTRRRFGVLVDQQVHAAFPRHPVAQFVHRLELPGGIDMQQRKRRRRGIECLARQVQHHRTVLADRIEHHRTLGLGHHLAHDVDRFGFKALEVGQAGSHREVI